MDPLDRLVKCLSRLPGVGRKSAERMAVRLIRDNGMLMTDLVAALQDAEQRVTCCSRCGCITVVDVNPCRLCIENGRDDSLLCVVEDPGDIELMERSGAFKGRYHALMGKLSPMKGDGLADVRIQALMERVDNEAFREVVLALSTDVEGDATASFLSELLAKKHVKVSRLAFGLPAGSGLSYSDSVTLGKAMSGRTQVGLL